MGSPNTLSSSAAVDVPDNILFTLGNDSDGVVVLNSAGIAANTALTGVLIGTPVSSAVAANSLMISNTTASGDIALYYNLAGNSQMALWVDASAQTIYAYDDINIGAKSLETTTLSLYELDTNTFQITDNPITAAKNLQVGVLQYVSGVTAMGTPLYFRAQGATGAYVTFEAQDTGAGLVETARLAGAADPYFQIGRDDTGVALNAVTDMLVLQAGGGSGNESAGFGLGIVAKLGNAASEVEERGSIDLTLDVATDAAERSSWHFTVQQTTPVVALDIYGTYLNSPLGFYFSGSTDESAEADYVKVGGYEISAGHRALCIGCEEVVVVETDETKFSHKLPVRINGATYNLMLTAT